MIITILIFVVALAFVLFLLWFEPWRQSTVYDDPRVALQPISVPALMNLIDTRNMEFLRVSLPAADFRKARRERIRVLRVYVRRISYNTRILMDAAESARQATDPVVAESGRVLLESALATRTRALKALASLYAGELFPSLVPDLSPAIHTYESAAARLATLRDSDLAQ